jgi:anti-anti-sigma factor
MSDVRHQYSVRQVPFAVAPDGPNGMRLEGELDIASAGILRDALPQLSTTDQPTLDLTELTFIDSSGLNVISEYARSLDGGARLVLTNVDDNIRRVFEVTGLDRMPTLDVRSGG